MDALMGSRLESAIERCGVVTIRMSRAERAAMGRLAKELGLSVESLVRAVTRQAAARLLFVAPEKRAEVGAALAEEGKPGWAA